MVPTGTFRTTPSPSRPVLFEPSPCRPRPALYSGLKRKCTRVLWRSLDSIHTSPPRPPSPPDGPPRGTNFSRRKATHPLPPLPALTRIRVSSMNMLEGSQGSHSWLRGYRHSKFILNENDKGFWIPAKSRRLEDPPFMAGSGGGLGGEHTNR